MAKNTSVSTKITFDEIKKLAEKDRWDRELIDKLDHFLGVSLLVAPVAAGPAGMLALELLQPKQELIKLAKAAANRFVKTKTEDFIARQRRLAAAYTLLHFTSFFEALESVAPYLFSAVAMTEPEKLSLISRETDPTFRVITTVAMPHPTVSPKQERNDRLHVYDILLRNFGHFARDLEAWERRHEDLGRVSAVAADLFDAHYLELLIEVPAFAKWAEVLEFAKVRQLTADMSARLSAEIGELSAGTQKIDIGLAQLRRLVEAQALRSPREQALKIAQSLDLAYQSRIEEPVIRDSYAEEADTLTYPRRCDIFVPQAFKVLHHVNAAVKLELDTAWEDVPTRDDVGGFVVAFLDSAYSTESALLVLGHPGSGKSLLTEMMAATLGQHYHPVRIELRNTNAESDLQDQVEEQIRRTTGHDVNWAEYAEQLADTPPVIILDGYDELLQASGKVFSNYLTTVQAFQRREAVQGRPVRIIVTSRLTLIDKAAIPSGTTVLRLLEFDEDRQQTWIHVWNEVNRDFFARRQVTPFSLEGATGVGYLAAQPLLLLMLAVYDSAANGLRDTNLDRTSLYYSLLTRFIKRERIKGDGSETFNAMSADEQSEQIERDMERLGVAAIAMFNRRSLHIHQDDLNRAILHFGVEQPIAPAHGQPLTQADLLLGSFFFIHESKAYAAERESKPAAFEFLHNTFGEFLTAHFILRLVLDETSMQRKLSGDAEFEEIRLTRQAEPPPGWYARLMFTSLHTRPVVLSMMSEWLPHRLQAAGRSRGDFEHDLAAIATRQINEVLRGSVPAAIAQRPENPAFEALPTLGHLAVYSLNTVLLWTTLANEVRFDERQFATEFSDRRPWDRLTHLWRSWFSFDSLASLASVFVSERDGHMVSLKRLSSVRHAFSVMSDVRNTAWALGDDITYGLATLCAFELGQVNSSVMSDSQTRLHREGIDVRPLANVRLAQWDLPLFKHVDFDRLVELRTWDHLPPDVMALFEMLDRVATMGDVDRLPVWRRISLGDFSRLSRYEAALVVRLLARSYRDAMSDILLEFAVAGAWSYLLETPAAAPLLQAASEFVYDDRLDSTLDAIYNNLTSGASPDLETVFAILLLAGNADRPDVMEMAWERVTVQLEPFASLREVTEAQLAQVIDLVVSRMGSAYAATLHQLVADRLEGTAVLAENPALQIQLLRLALAAVGRLNAEQLRLVAYVQRSPMRREELAYLAALEREVARSQGDPGGVGEDVDDRAAPRVAGADAD